MQRWNFGLSRVRPAGGSEDSRLTLRESRQSFQVWTELLEQFGNVLVAQRQRGATQLVAAGSPVDPFLFGFFPKAALEPIATTVVFTHPAAG